MALGEERPDTKDAADVAHSILLLRSTKQVLIAHTLCHGTAGIPL
jgi:hypothetical protein